VFDENPSAKVGVRFDKPIPDGVDLGELCESGHGFFCKGTSCSVVHYLLVRSSSCLTQCFFCFLIATDLPFKSSSFKDLVRLLVNTLFEVLFSCKVMNFFFPCAYIFFLFPGCPF